MTRNRVVESDVCIIGAGIIGAMVAEKLSDERQASMVVVEAGAWTTPLSERFESRRRFLAYGENPWRHDHVADQKAPGIVSRSMVVGGWAMHWGGVSPRYTPEDFRLRTLYGAGDDWPLSYEELEPFYQEAEERIGVAGEAGPRELDPRSKPYPMPPLPLSYNLARLKAWAGRSGIPFWTGPEARNSVPYGGRAPCVRCDTCSICPTGAKYSPDHTFQRLIQEGKITLLSGTLVQRLVLRKNSDRVEYALAVDRNRPERPVELRASTFIMAAGYAWIPHLLLLSANTRFPNGLANRSGLVGKSMHGHRATHAHVEVPVQLYPGVFRHLSLYTSQFERPKRLQRYVRHDLRIAESSYGGEPRLRNETGEIQFGNEILADWRVRTKAVGRANVRAVYDVLPHRESGIRLDPSLRNAFGDPMPRVELRDSQESSDLRPYTQAKIQEVFRRLVRAGGGKILEIEEIPGQHHPGGGCRMGNDAATSVTDSFGRTHDHENLFVVGGATAVTSGCTNSTLTFAALALRQATEIGRSFPTKQVRESTLREKQGTPRLGLTARKGG